MNTITWTQTHLEYAAVYQVYIVVNITRFDFTVHTIQLWTFTFWPSEWSPDCLICSRVNYTQVQSPTSNREDEEEDNNQHIRKNKYKKEIEDTKEVIRIRISKDTQHKGQKKKDKRTNNDLQSITHKTKDRTSRTPLKTGDELGCSGRVGSSCSTSGIHRVTLVTNMAIIHQRTGINVESD